MRYHGGLNVLLRDGNAPTQAWLWMFPDTLTGSILFVKTAESILVTFLDRRQMKAFEEVNVCDKEKDSKRHATHGAPPSGKSSRSAPKLG